MSTASTTDQLTLAPQADAARFLFSVRGYHPDEQQETTDLIFADSIDQAQDGIHEIRVLSDPHWRITHIVAIQCQIERLQSTLASSTETNVKEDLAALIVELEGFRCERCLPLKRTDFQQSSTPGICNDCHAKSEKSLATISGPRTLTDVTFYTQSAFAVTRTDCRNITIELAPYAQYKQAVKLTYTPKGKRSTRSTVLTYDPYLVIVATSHAVEPAPAFLPTTSSTTADCSTSRYSSQDSRWRTDFDTVLMQAHTPILADYRGFNTLSKL